MFDLETVAIAPSSPGWPYGENVQVLSKTKLSLLLCHLLRVQSIAIPPTNLFAGLIEYNSVEELYSITLHLWDTTALQLTVFLTGLQCCWSEMGYTLWLPSAPPLSRSNLLSCVAISTNFQRTCPALQLITPVCGRCCYVGRAYSCTLHTPWTLRVLPTRAMKINQNLN